MAQIESQILPQVDRICEATSQEQSVPANTVAMIKNP